MEGKFEKYFIEKRSEFDDKTPPESVWRNVEKKLQSTSSVNYLRYWQAAAVVFFVVSIGFIYNSFQPSDTQLAVTDTIEEFSNTEEYYFDVIESQQGILTSYLDHYPELANDFKKDISELSQNYTKLKKDFDTTGDKEVLNALIQNLQLQQELLRNQLNIIQQIEEENENISI